MSVFGKISKIQSKTPLDIAIVLGDLFADPSSTTTEDDETISALLDDKINIPLPIYFTIGRHALPPRIIERLDLAGGEVCTNLHFLGKRSTTKTSEGVRIVALGGVLDPNGTAGLSKDKYSPFHTEADTRSLHGVNMADILVTNDWPTAIRTKSKVPLPDGIDEPTQEQCIADLCTALQPRYHFSQTHHAFYEREPFFHKAAESSHLKDRVTRFLSLASPTCEPKAKWFYAFSYNPGVVFDSFPPGTTSSPLVNTKKRSRQDDAAKIVPYESLSSNPSLSDPYKRRRNNKKPAEPSECFFCLANQNISTHLITSIATDSYLTTAKGPLTLPTTFPGLNVPSHILLIPMIHSPTLGSVMPPEARRTIYAELQRYRSALHTMIASTTNNELGAVTWELSRSGLRHFHWQLIPIKRSLIVDGLVEAAFKVEAENNNLNKFSQKQIGDGVGEGDYFRVWIWSPRDISEQDNNPSLEPIAILDDETNNAARPTIIPDDKDPAKNTVSDPTDIPDSDDPIPTKNGSSSTPTAIPPSASAATTPGIETELVLPLAPDDRFDVQFGRIVMGKLLGLNARLDWRRVEQTEEEEEKDAKAFQEIFRKWDFSLQEGGEEEKGGAGESG